MKIYQLHEYSGEYEDYRDRIIGSYVIKERAEEEKTKDEQEELKKQLLEQQCRNCPYHDNIDDCGTMANLMRKYCDHSDIHCDSDGELFCKNFYLHWRDSNFDITEVEVEE